MKIQIIPLIPVWPVTNQWNIPDVVWTLWFSDADVDWFLDRLHCMLPAPGRHWRLPTGTRSVVFDKRVCSLCSLCSCGISLPGLKNKKLRVRMYKTVNYSLLISSYLYLYFNCRAGIFGKSRMSRPPRQWNLKLETARSEENTDWWAEYSRVQCWRKHDGLVTRVKSENKDIRYDDEDDSSDVSDAAITHGGVSLPGWWDILHS